MAKVKIETAATTKLEGHNPQASQEFAEGAGNSQSRCRRIRKPVSGLSTETTDDDLFCKEATNFMAEVKECDKADAQLCAVVLTQSSLKAGIKEWGEEAEVVAMKECTQLHERAAMRPINVNQLTQAECIKAVGSLMFLKQKEGSVHQGQNACRWETTTRRNCQTRILKSCSKLREHCADSGH